MGSSCAYEFTVHELYVYALLVRKHKGLNCSYVLHICVLSPSLASVGKLTAAAGSVIDIKSA